MAAAFVFVSSGPGGEKNSADRTRIRSHCMRGRNKREGSRRSVQQAAKDAREAGRKPHEALAVGIHRHSPSLNGQHSGPTPEAQLVRAPPRSLLLAAPLGLGVDQFAKSVDKSVPELLHHVNSFVDIVHSTYRVEQCINFGPEEEQSLYEEMAFEEAFLHNVLLATSAAKDRALGRPLGPTARYHLSKILVLVNKRLSDRTGYVLESTIYIILVLAVLSASFGDYAAADAHMTGLQRLLLLRGGAERYRGRHLLQNKLETLDLMWCLDLGGAPRFITEPTSWEPSFEGPTPTRDCQLSLEPYGHLFDSRLVVVFQDLQQLTKATNDYYRRNTRLGASVFQPANSSIQSRLFYLKDRLDDAPSQCLCLGMLALLTSMFGGPGMQPQYSYLGRRLRHAFRSLRSSPIPLELRTLTLWLLLVYRMTVPQTDEPWLRASWRAAAPSTLSWDQARQELKRVPWIECLHDKQGRRAFEALMRQDDM